MFWCLFLLNETTRSKKQRERGSTKQCRFERHCASSSPRHTEAGEEEVSLPCNATLLSLSLPPPHLPKS